MIKGSTIIMSEAYIDELTRHKDNWTKKLNVETNPGIREKIQNKVTYLENKLEDALEFQDIVDEIINIDIPRITSVRTISGLVIPINNVQVL